MMTILVPTAFEAQLLFKPNECQALANRAMSICSIGGHKVTVSICGFGLAAAGAGAAFAFGKRAPANDSPLGNTGHVILAGIAGTYAPARAPVGSALLATDVHCFGIGRGSGRAHRSAESLGWYQGHATSDLVRTGDHLPLHAPDLPGDSVTCGGLLSVPASAANAHEALQHSQHWPDAIAEEMEGFAVGLAARLYAMPLTIIRGLSNVAGDTDHDAWQIAEALDAVKTLLIRVVDHFASEEAVC